MRNGWLCLLLLSLLAVSCRTQVPPATATNSPSQPHPVVAVCGLQLGDQVAEAWEAKKEYGDKLINYREVDGEGLVEIYGTTVTINGTTFSNGDPAAEILKILGPPKEKYPSDYPPPDKAVRYDYPEIGFGFSTDEDERFVTAGFGLFRTSPMRQKSTEQKRNFKPESR